MRHEMISGPRTNLLKGNARDVIEQLILKSLAAIILLHASYTFMSPLLVGYSDEGGRLFLALLPGLIVTWVWFLRAVRGLTTNFVVRSKKDLFLLDFLGFERGFQIGKWAMPLLVLGLLDSLVHFNWSSASIAFAVGALIRLRSGEQLTEERSTVGKE